MASTQELTRRIKSIKSTRKVTRAMQMISAAKMRKSQAATVASRTYSELALELVSSLRSAASGKGIVSGARADDIPSYIKLLSPNASSVKTLVVVISTNKGLVGGFNSNLFAQIKKIEETYDSNNLEYIIMGRKAMDMAVRMRRKVVADFAKSENIPSIQQIVPVARLITDLFVQGGYNSVHIVYNHFISTLSQQARTVQLLPLSLSHDDPVEVVEVGELAAKSLQPATSNQQLKTIFPYRFHTLMKLQFFHVLHRIFWGDDRIRVVEYHVMRARQQEA